MFILMEHAILFVNILFVCMDNAICFVNNATFFHEQSYMCHEQCYHSRDKCYILLLFLSIIYISLLYDFPFHEQCYTFKNNAICLTKRAICFNDKCYIFHEYVIFVIIQAEQKTKHNNIQIS